MGLPFHQEARRRAADERGRLTVGGRISRPRIYRLCNDVDQLAVLVEAAEHRPDYAEDYARLVEDYNAIWDGVRATLAIEVGQRHSGAWEWRWGVERGEAATPALALLAGLRAAGARRPPPPPLDAQLRAAGVPQLPGIDEADYADERAAAQGGEE